MYTDRDRERTVVPFDGMDDTLPTLIAFDLDYTLWPGWIDTHYTGPLRRPSATTLNHLLDNNDKRLSLYPNVARILHRLQMSQIHLAATSRTPAPELTRDALALLLVPPPKERPRERPQRAIDFFESLEIYPDTKRVHFSEIHKKTQIPYSNMLFFAGDTSELPSNSDVQYLGVTFVPINPKVGVTEQAVEDGIREWRRRRALRSRVRKSIGSGGSVDWGRNGNNKGNLKVQQEDVQEEGEGEDEDSTMEGSEEGSDGTGSTLW